jgi:FAD:protein FMN transferase
MSSKIALFFTVLFSVSFSGLGQLQRFSYTQPKMGSPFTIIMYCSDSATAAGAAARCFRLVDTINQQLSDYLPGSELNLLSAKAGNGEWMAVPERLMDVLRKSIYAYGQSGGGFNITIGPLTRLWRKARAENRFPEKAMVATALQAVNGRGIVIDTVRGRAMLTHKNMQLDMGGIAKGYAAQAIIDYLQSVNISIALADAGGDIAAGEAPPGKKGWQLGLTIPRDETALWDQHLLLAKAAVATSGDAYQFMQQGGKRYSHIIDPRTGYGVTHRRNVTIIAADGALADWLATACSVLPVKKALQLAEKMNAQLLMAEWRKGAIRTYQSKDWNSYWNRD